jgi:hypothetical protein
MIRPSPGWWSAKARKATQAKTVTKAKAKPASAKKVVRKGRLPVGPAVETVAAEVIEQPAATDEASTSPAV